MPVKRIFLVFIFPVLSVALFFSLTDKLIDLSVVSSSEEISPSSISSGDDGSETHCD